MESIAQSRAQLPITLTARDSRSREIAVVSQPCHRTMCVATIHGKRANNGQVSR